MKPLGPLGSGTLAAAVLAIACSSGGTTSGKTPDPPPPAGDGVAGGREAAKIVACAGEGDEFATVQLGTPWNGERPFPFWQPERQKDGEGLVPSFDGGITRLVAGPGAQRAEWVNFLWQGWEKWINQHDGRATPIDRSYNRIALALYLDPTRNPADPARRNDESEYFIVTTSAGNAKIQWMEPGFHFYIVDLAAESFWPPAGATGEAALIRQLGAGFARVRAGEVIQLDWVRLTRSVTFGPDRGCDLAWGGIDAKDGILDLEVVPADPRWEGNGIRIGHVTGALASGSFRWANGGDPKLARPGDLEPGTYHVRGVQSDGTKIQLPDVAIGNAALATITAPSFDSGPSFADDSGLLWDFSRASDYSVINLDRYSTDPATRTLDAASTSNAAIVTFSAPPGGAYDTARYHYLSFDLYSKYATLRNPDGQDYGDFISINWRDDPVLTAPIHGGPSLIGVAQQWIPYHIDLRSIDWMDAAGLWTARRWRNLQFWADDSSELVRQNQIELEWKLRNVRLTGTPEARGSYGIAWNVDNPEASEPITVNLYWAGTRWGNDLHPIATLAGSTGAGTFVWDTSALAAGEAYVVVCADDGFGPICRHSDVPVRIVAP